MRKLGIKPGSVVAVLNDPGEFLELAQLAPDEVARLEGAWAGSEQTMGWPSLDGDDKLQRIAPLWVTIHDARRRYRA